MKSSSRPDPGTWGPELPVLITGTRPEKGRSQMEKYMVVYAVEKQTGAAFFDDITAAEQFRMDTECGMGGYAEVYERQTPTEENDYFDGYEFLYS